MPDLSYLLWVMAIALGITFALRAVPFAILEPLRESAFVAHVAAWMPVGILAILALHTFLADASGGGGFAWRAVAALAVTIAVHLACGRRTLLSVGAGTLAYVLLVNLV